MTEEDTDTRPSLSPTSEGKQELQLISFSAVRKCLFVSSDCNTCFLGKMQKIQKTIKKKIKSIHNPIIQS